MRNLLAVCLLLLTATVAADDTLKEIDWMSMIPPDELKAMEEMSEIDHSGGRMEQLFTSTNTVAALDGMRGKLPGYIVPIDSNADGRITEFFFVPYFGACLHMPPPPPNQIVHVKPKQPIKAGTDWDAFWMIGTLRVDLTENGIAKSAYSFDLERVELIEMSW